MKETAFVVELDPGRYYLSPSMQAMGGLPAWTAWADVTLSVLEATKFNDVAYLHHTFVPEIQGLFPKARIVRVEAEVELRVVEIPEPVTGKDYFSLPPKFHGLDPETGEGYSPTKIVKLLDLGVASAEAVEAACIKVVAANPDQAAAYKGGKANLIGHFMKLVMAETNGKASPKDANEALRRILALV